MAGDPPPAIFNEPRLKNVTLEVVALAIAFVENERLIVGNRVSLKGSNFSDRRNLRSLLDLLLVKDLFSQPDHCVTRFTRIP